MAGPVLITGVLGCLGAWVAKCLLDDDRDVVGFDLDGDRTRLELIVGSQAARSITLVQGDLCDREALEYTLDRNQVTDVIHLAGLQIPACRADPVGGARVNVVGMSIVIEAIKARRERIDRLVYASSAAVYGASDNGEHDERPRPWTHYGVYKLADEGLARVAWQEDGLPSFGLRPYVVYGPGRDQGLTSAVTAAMDAAAHGEPFRVPFGGRAIFDYAPDVARAFVWALEAPTGGATVTNLPGRALHMSEVVAAIVAAVPSAQITYEDVQLPLPRELESRLETPFVWTPFEQGVAETIEFFRRAKAGVAA